MYYVDSFSNTYTSFPNSEIKSLKNNTGDNDSQKLIIKSSNKLQYNNYRYRRKNKRGMWVYLLYIFGKLNVKFCVL